ncbi:MAG: hypothetical protein ACM3X6_13750 [Patescibacteria group bacterium]
MPRAAFFFLIPLLLVAGNVLRPAGAAPPLPEQETRRVERVAVAVQTAARLPAVLRARLETSVAKVAERIMLGRPVHVIHSQEEYCARIIRDVFTKILTGFYLDELAVEVDVETRITIRLSPDGPVIERIEIPLDLPGLAGPARALLEEEISALYPELSDFLLGLPIASMAWADPILTAAIADRLRLEFPGFEPGVSIRPGASAALDLTMVPDRPAVERIVVEITSETLPRFLARTWTGRAASHFQACKGLPLAFLRRRLIRLENLGQRLLQEDPASTRLGLRWEVALYPGETTVARLAVEAGACSLQTQARLTFSDPLVFGFALCVGYRPYAGWEISGRLGLDTGGAGADWSGSLSYAMSPAMSLGFTYSTLAAEHLLWLRYEEEGYLLVLGGEVGSGRLLAAIGIATAEDLMLILSVDSLRQYRLALEMNL